MSKLKKLAIINDGYDILRLIPMNIDKNTLDLKIKPFNELKLEFIGYNFNFKNSLWLEKLQELSYHSSNIENKPKIHIKDL